MVKAYAREMIHEALQASGIAIPVEEVRVEIPKKEFGDVATNVALHLAKVLRRSPREIAESLVKRLQTTADLEHVEVAGPGFINLRFSRTFWHRLLRTVIQSGEQWGRSTSAEHRTVNIEFVSANPTGPLHLGHGRNAAIGDTLANLYEWQGYEVTREYYFNNAGHQMKMLALSIYARYRQLLDEPDYPFPEEGYRGEYIMHIAQQLLERYGDQLREGTPQQLYQIQKFGERYCFEMINHTLERLRVRFDVYYNEDRLYQEGKVEAVIQALRDKGLVYEHEGALWLRLTAIGRPQDRVIVKSSGEPTYRLPDIAYHREKFERGYNLIVDVLGADHIATIEDVKAAIAALGYDAEKIRIILYQFVTLVEAGKPVKMSKRSGKAYTLDTLIDEVGADVVRFFFVMRGVAKHLEFDLGLAREQSEKNPVFYLQYAHARIASIFRKYQQMYGRPENSKLLDSVRWLSAEEEITLIRQLAQFPEVLQAATEAGEPVIVADYLRDLAGAFHRFYHQHSVLHASSPQREGRLALLQATQTTLRNGLTILGVSAPDRM